MSAAQPAPIQPRRLARWLYWLFIVLMVGLTALFAALGMWQLNRLGEKEALIEIVAARMTDPPRELPPVAEWVGFDPAVFDYRPVAMTGTLMADRTVLVFTSLSDPNGRHGGPGYWVMTPLALEGGGTVWLNRGFIPQAQASAFADGGTLPAGSQAFTGIARAAEEASGFTPVPDRAKRIDYVRDPARLSALVQLEPPVAPVYVDLAAGEAGALPQGGETVLSFPNSHLGYAITWFGFALLTPVLLVVWIMRERRP